jgi:Zn-dependent protease
VPNAATELEDASADIPLTRDAREILKRATQIAEERGSEQTSASDVLEATVQAPDSLAGREIKALGIDPARIDATTAASESVSLRQLLVNANRESQVLGHYQVDSIHLLLALLYSDSPATSEPLQKAGLTLYNLRNQLQTGVEAVSSDRALRRRPWPTLRGVFTISPVFIGLVGATAAAGALLWTGLPSARFTPILTIVFVVAGWITSLCIHEFGHALVAYIGGDRAVATSGYLTLNPLRYTNVYYSLVLPVLFLLLGGIALPGGAVYINHSALRSRAWSSAVSLAGPAGTLLSGLIVAAPFMLSRDQSWLFAHANFAGALGYLGFFEALALLLNLLPVPGLDGFGVIRPWLSYSMQVAAMRYSMFAIYGVFIVLWFVPPVRIAFYGAVFALSTAVGINPLFIITGQSNMRFQ